MTQVSDTGTDALNKLRPEFSDNARPNGIALDPAEPPTADPAPEPATVDDPTVLHPVQVDGDPAPVDDFDIEDIEDDLDDDEDEDDEEGDDEDEDDDEAEEGDPSTVDSMDEPLGYGF